MQLPTHSRRDSVQSVTAEIFSAVESEIININLSSRPVSKYAARNMEGGPTSGQAAPPTPAAANLLNGKPNAEYLQYTEDNLHAWNTIADFWEESQSPEWSGKADDGNDMFQQCLLPVVWELANWREGQTVLDCGSCLLHNMAVGSMQAHGKYHSADVNAEIRR